MSEVISAAGRVHLLLALSDGVGPILFSRLLERFGDAEAIVRAPSAQLCEVRGIGRETADKIVRTRDDEAVEREIAAAVEHGVHIICRADPEFPEPLKRISDPPIVLFVKGELRNTDTISIAIVGSRRCTIYGSEQARRFGELLAQAGFTIVSGLARGIDAFGLHGAVDAGGRTMAVLGNGLTEIYPPENQALAEKILERGCWMSELPMKAAVRAENFPSRNRLISGLTLGTLVVEAATRSGALITARLASEYNREVFAIPGRVQDPMSFGTNGLIRDGAAKLVMTLEDILDELGDLGIVMKQGLDPRDARSYNDPAPGAPDAAPPASEARTAALTPIERSVYQAIGDEAELQEMVLGRLRDLPLGEVLAAFTRLELSGLVRRLPGQMIVRRTRA